jgi:hypothetical protein
MLIAPLIILTGRMQVSRVRPSACVREGSAYWVDDRAPPYVSLSPLICICLAIRVI